MKSFLLSLITLYQRYLSPDHSVWARSSDRLPYCKFTPSCSQYAKESIEKKGIIWGSLKALWRILRCNPWNSGGYDPVQDPKSKKKE